MKPTLIFDYDGTIHDTLHIYEPVMRATYHRLAQQGYVKEEPLSSARIAGWLGLNAKEMWDDFQPQLADEIKRQRETVMEWSHVCVRMKHGGMQMQGQRLTC